MQCLPLDTQLIVIFEFIAVEHEIAGTLTAPSSYFFNIYHGRVPFSSCL